MLGHRDAVGLVLSVALLLPPSASRGDEFDRLGGGALAALLRNGQTRTHPGAGLSRAGGPAVCPARPALCSVDREDRPGQPCATAGIARVPQAARRQGATGPALARGTVRGLRRGQSRSPCGAGKNLTLFPGFQLDLDTGQVVPEGLGGDLVFTARGDEDGIVSSLGAARISTLEKPPSLPPTAPGAPSEGRVVRPADFSGRFRLAANGQWSGLLELTVDPAGSVTGSFQSDASGSAYPVTGKVDPQLPSESAIRDPVPSCSTGLPGRALDRGKTGDGRNIDDDGSGFQLRRGPRGIQARPRLRIWERRPCSRPVSPEEPGSAFGWKPSPTGTCWVRPPRLGSS